MTNQEFIDDVEARVQEDFENPTPRLGFDINVLTLAFEDRELPSELVDEIDDWINLYGGSDWIDVIEWIWGKIKEAARWLWDKLFE